MFHSRLYNPKETAVGTKQQSTLAPGPVPEHNSVWQSLALSPANLSSSSGVRPSSQEAQFSEILSSSGRPLQRGTRTRMEASFGRDLGHVRLHTDSSAERSAQMVDARAYTSGSNIVFAAGQYNPHTLPGLKLIGHELAHVLQQERNGSQREGQPAEREANVLSRDIADGRQVSVSETAHGIQRQPAHFLSEEDVGPEDLQKRVLESLELKDAKLKSKAEGRVTAGDDLAKMWTTINSSHEFDPPAHLIYARYFLENFIRAQQNREVDSDEMFGWLLQVEEAHQRNAEELNLKIEAMWQEHDQKQIEREIWQIQADEAFEKLPTRIDPRAYHGLQQSWAAPFSDPFLQGILDVSIYFIPIVGQARGIMEFVSGHSLLTGEELTLFDRVLAGLPLIPIVLRGGQIVIKGASLLLSTAKEKAALIMAISYRTGQSPSDILSLLKRLDAASVDIETLRKTRNALAKGRKLSAQQAKALNKLDEAIVGRSKTAGAEAGTVSDLSWSADELVDLEKQGITDINQFSKFKQLEMQALDKGAMQVVAQGDEVVQSGVAVASGGTTTVVSQAVTGATTATAGWKKGQRIRDIAKLATQAERLAMLEALLKDPNGLTLLANHIKGLGQRAGATFEIARAVTKNGDTVLVIGANTSAKWSGRQLSELKALGIHVADQAAKGMKLAPHAEENIAAYLISIEAKATRWSRAVVGEGGSYVCSGCKAMVERVGGIIEDGI